MSVEQIKTNLHEQKDLSDLSWIEMTQEWVDISKKMELILEKTQDHTNQVKEENDNKVIAMAQERLWILIWENQKEQEDFISMLDSSLVV